MKVLIFATHPIQYQIPIYRNLSSQIDLKVIYLLNQTKKGQADAGFGVEFEWDIPLLEGYEYNYMRNLSNNPSSSTYNGIIIEYKDLARLIKLENPDVVMINGWFPKGLKQIINYCYKNNIRTICRGDSNLMMPTNPIKKILKEFYIRNILKQITAFLYVGKENKKYYNHYGVSDDRLFSAYHCINTPFFKEKFENCDRPIFNPNDINLGFAGKFIDIKNPILLIEAVAKNKFKNNITLQFIGDGPLKGKIETSAKEHGVKINFIGFLNQSEIVEKGYSKIDFLVLPSKSETWGLVVNEVMTGGIPVITSDSVGCNSDLIENGHTGFTFKNGNSLDLSNKIEQTIDLFKKNYTFKTNVLSKIEFYSLENTSQSYITAIEKIIQLK